MMTINDIMILTGTPDWCLMYRPEVEFWWGYKNEKLHHQSCSSVMYKNLFNLIGKLPTATKKLGIKSVEGFYNNMFNSNPNKRITF